MSDVAIVYHQPDKTWPGMLMPDKTGAGWEAVSALLDELLDLDEGPRALRLAQIRSQNATLGDHIAGLLSHCLLYTSDAADE